MLPSRVSERLNSKVGRVVYSLDVSVFFHKFLIFRPSCTFRSLSAAICIAFTGIMGTGFINALCHILNPVFRSLAFRTCYPTIVLAAFTAKLSTRLIYIEFSDKPKEPYLELLRYDRSSLLGSHIIVTFASYALYCSTTLYKSHTSLLFIVGYNYFDVST